MILSIIITIETSHASDLDTERRQGRIQWKLVNNTGVQPAKDQDQ